MKRILIIEDEAALASALVAVCKRAGHDAVSRPSAAKGLDTAVEESFDLIVVDIGLPDRSGLELIDDLLDDDEPPAILVITAHGNLDNAIAARRAGASEYLVKPFDMGRFLQVLDELTDDSGVSSSEITSTGDESRQRSLFLGGSVAMQSVFRRVAQATTSDVPVLITGATGTGKSLCARVIHEHSDRADGPFVALHCSALPAQLLEAELFGHEKSAFSGANSVKIGHLERAAGGTLFLDEIGSLGTEVQARLLRFIEEKTFVRLGGREDLTIDCRVIAATRTRLPEAVAGGSFREDLYYRLQVLSIELPPLSRRMEDVPALASWFLALAGREDQGFAADVFPCLRGYTWPGNVRELRNAIEHAIAVCGGNVVHASHLPDELQAGGPVEVGSDLEESLREYVERGLASGWTWQEFHDQLEDRLLALLLEAYDHKSTVLARELRMNRSTLLKKRKRIENKLAE